MDLQTLPSENTSLAAVDFLWVVLEEMRGAGEHGDSCVQLLLSFTYSLK